MASPDQSKGHTVTWAEVHRDAKQLVHKLIDLVPTIIKG